MERIIDRDRFVAFARERGVRADWHEPDEQDLTAYIEGVPLNFDNAGFWPAKGEDERVVELHVIFAELEYDDAAGKRLRGRDIACVNLATLCAWASEAHPDVPAAVAAATGAIRRRVSEALDRL